MEKLLFTPVQIGPIPLKHRLVLPPLSRLSSPLGAAYSASKFALEALTESLHLEVRHFGIEPHKGPADYAGLWEQWAGADTKMTGLSGRPGPEVVALAIASAIEPRDTAPCTGRPRR